MKEKDELNFRDGQKEKTSIIDYILELPSDYKQA
jgi:hypothetical protein